MVRRRTLPPFVALVAGLLLVAAQPVAAITFGTPTGASAYQNVGALVETIDGSRFQVCSGSLIADGVFLTAAHCVTDIGSAVDLGDVHVNFRHDLAAAGDIDVTDVEVDPHVAIGNANPFDIAVLLFDSSHTPVGVDPVTVAPVGYLDSLSQLRSRAFVAVGYGLTRNAKQKGPWALAEASQRMSVQQRVQSLVKAWVTFSQNPSTGNGGGCYGDSGGPHFRAGTDVVVSITNTGDRWCRATDKTYRLDTPWAHDFLDPYLP